MTLSNNGDQHLYVSRAYTFRPTLTCYVFINTRLGDVYGLMKSEKMFRYVFQKQPVFMTDMCLTDRKLLSTVLASLCIIIYYVDCVIAWSSYNVIPVTPVFITSST